MQNYSLFCQFRSKLAIKNAIGIKWKEKYDTVVVDCHHSLCLCGDRMKKSLPKKNFFLGRLPLLPGSPFRAKFWPYGQLFCPSHPLAYSLIPN